MVSMRGHELDEGVWPSEGDVNRELRILEGDEIDNRLGRQGSPDVDHFGKPGIPADGHCGALLGVGGQVKSVCDHFHGVAYFCSSAATA